MTSPRIVAQPAGRFLASRISSSGCGSAAAAAAVRQTSSSLSVSTSSSSVVAAISSSLSSSSSCGSALPTVVDYQRRGISSSSCKSGSISMDYYSRQTPASSLTSCWMVKPSSSSSHPSLLQYRHQRQSFVTSTSPLQTSAKEQPASTKDDECPPWQNPLHHNNPEYTRVLAEEFAPGEEMPIVPLPPFDDQDDGDKVTAPPNLHELADEIVRLNMLEMKELVDRIGDHFGFTDDEEDYMDGGGGGGDGGSAAVEEAKVEKTAFDLKLTGFDAKAKIKVIKEIRGLTSLGLKEAKELVEGAPTTVRKDIKMEEAEEIKAKLEAVGATVEIV